MQSSLLPANGGQEIYRRTKAEREQREMINGHTASHKRTRGLFISVHLMDVVWNSAMLDVTVKNLYLC